MLCSDTWRLVVSRKSFEIGHSAERAVIKALKGKLVPASGSTKWLKLDGYDKGGFVYSIKASDTISDPTIRGIARLWRETIRGTRGFVGHGDGAKPAMVFSVEGEFLMLCRLNDHIDMATAEAPAYIPVSKAEVRRAHVRRSLLE